jgi:hypothetical protein
MYFNCLCYVREINLFDEDLLVTYLNKILIATSVSFRFKMNLKGLL